MDRAVSYLYELSAAAGGGVVASNGTPGQGLSQGPSPGLTVNSQLPTEHLIAPGNENYCLRWNEFEKKTGARKSCPYCNKDFHEMSLKRHIKDVHFRSQNTYVICPQCCKQYASQNSLYSHLNRVHNVKKDVMADIQIPMGNNQGGGPSAQHNYNNHHDGIVNLTHHSDSSNG